MALITHKTAKFEYQLTDTYTAGIVLSGPEVKSIRLGHGSLTGSFVKILSQEAFLVNAQISPYKFASVKDYDPKRTRKLLLTKHELDHLIGIVERKKVTLVPLTLGAKGRNIKLIFAVGVGKKTHEKRADVKRRDERRQVERLVKTRLKGF